MILTAEIFSRLLCFWMSCPSLVKPLQPFQCKSHIMIPAFVPDPPCVICFRLIHDWASYHYKRDPLFDKDSMFGNYPSLYAQ